MPYNTLSAEDLAYFDSVGDRLPQSHRFSVGRYVGETMLKGLHVLVTNPATNESVPGLRLFRGMRRADIGTAGIASLGAHAESAPFEPNPVQRFVEAVHKQDDTIRDGMIGRHVRAYAHNQNRHASGNPDFASPFLSTSPRIETAREFARNEGEVVAEMHVPLDRLVVDPVYNMALGHNQGLALPRDVLVLGGVAAHEIHALHE